MFGISKDMTRKARILDLSIKEAVKCKRAAIDELEADVDLPESVRKSMLKSMRADNQWMESALDIIRVLNLGG